jgi:hypothetical protein
MQSRAPCVDDKKKRSIRQHLDPDVFETHLADLAGHWRMPLQGEGSQRQPSASGRKLMLDIGL